MAAAVTTGVVSLMIEAARTTSRQTPTPNTIKSALEFTAVQLAGFDTLTQGAGSLNANGAIRLIETLDLGAPEGDWWLTNAMPPLDAAGGTSLTWSQRIVFGVLQGAVAQPAGPAANHSFR
ncbi:MAG: hypothetical protein HYX76_03860 [Acidobacteria bacterium]|nr:hypothetical protein [Acidobacteriota bacterium]